MTDWIYLYCALSSILLALSLINLGWLWVDLATKPATEQEVRFVREEQKFLLKAAVVALVWPVVVPVLMYRGYQRTKWFSENQDND